MKELILYIADKCQADPTFGATKLNKILFYADFMSFAVYGAPVTGVEYQRLEHGPAPRALKPIQREMEENRDIATRVVKYHAKDQKRVIPLRDADLDLFRGKDIAMVDEVIRQLWGKTAKEVSYISHGPWWRACHDGETIPYQFAYLSDDPIGAGDIERTGELARELGWQTQ